MTTEYVVTTLMCIVSALLLPCAAQENKTWSYDANSADGPQYWKNSYPMCGLASQSPVDITTTVSQKAELAGLSMSNYNTPPTNLFTLVNNGHSAQINVNTNTISVTGGGLGSTYVLEQFHFHWGSNDSFGSEHIVNGNPHPLEIHLVHYNSAKYSNVTQAKANTSDTTGVAVIGVFVDVATNDESTALGNITTLLSLVPYEGNSTQIAPFQLSSLLPSTQSFYRYNGSLTTPDCAQVVIWTVFTTPVYITQKHLQQFRDMWVLPEEHLLYNNRPVQSLNSRIVYLYSGSSSMTSTDSRRAWFYLLTVFVSFFAAAIQRVL